MSLLNNWAILPTLKPFLVGFVVQQYPGKLLSTLSSGEATSAQRREKLGR